MVDDFNLREPYRPLCERLIDALEWFGRGVSGHIPGARVVDYVPEVLTRTLSGFLAFWVSVLRGMGSRSIPTRRGSSIFATTDQMGPTIRKRMVPRSPSLASPRRGASRGQARMWCDKYYKFSEASCHSSG
jgi:hypothetical protein